MNRLGQSCLARRRTLLCKKDELSGSLQFRLRSLLASAIGNESERRLGYAQS